MTYSELKTAIANWLARSDVTANIDQLVDVAEAAIRRDVRVSAMESFATGTLSSGVATLPTDYLDARQFVVGTHPYTYVTPETYQREVVLNSQERFYTRVGNSLYVVNGGSESYSLLYRASFAALSADEDTNWLLTYAPDVYMYQGLKQAAVFVKDVEAASGYEALYQQAKDAVNSADKAGRLSSSAAIRPSRYA